MFKVGENVSFKIGDKVKFKKSSLTTGMIDAKEDDVFTISQFSEEHWGCVVKLFGVYGAVSVSHLEHVKEETLNSTEEQEIKWEVGQEVWDVRNGRGIVKSTEYEGGYPIFVEFDLKEFGGENVADCYTLDGRYAKTQTLRSLFFSEPKIEAEKFPPKKPFVPTLKQGDKVVMKLDDRICIVTIEKEGEDEIFIEQQVSGFRYMKKYIKVYKFGEEIIFN